jgi:WhiB family redox-sensing transcriptional regulator
MITDDARLAHCRANPDAMFVQGADQNDAKQVCRPCRIRTECLAQALDGRIRFGVWGGMTARERNSLLTRRPEVIDWAALLDRARRDHEAAEPYATTRSAAARSAGQAA